MTPTKPASTHVRFGGFEIDLRAGELRNRGGRISLQERPFQILLALVEHPGEVVTREELQQKLWSADTFVDFEHSINTAMMKLREALGDDAENPRYIQTLPKHGYRFICPVEPEPDSLQTVTEANREVVPRKTAPWPYRALVLATGVLFLLATVLVVVNVIGLRDHIDRLFNPPLRIRSIAVLPLENLSHDPEQEYFADGMTEELITNLGKISALRVISRTSVMQFKGTKKPLPEIARQLNVDALVEGTVMRSGDRVRITANLLHASADRHLWAESYERDLKEVLALQGEVARTVAQQIEAKLTPQEQKRISNVRRINPQALEHYLRGRYATQELSEQNLKEALGHFQAAIDLDPTYAQANVGLAATYYLLSNFWLPPKEAMPKSKAAALRALELDENLGEAHASLALVLSQYEWDWRGAESAYRRAIELAPSSALAHTGYGLYLVSMGNLGEAVAELNHAQELDPFSTFARISAVWPLYFGRRYEEAVPRLQGILQTDPDNPMAHFYLGQAFEGTGRCDKAIDEFGKAQQLADYPLAQAVMIGCLRKLGKHDEARRTFAKLQEQERRTYVSPYTLAVAHTNLGEKDRALEALEKAYQERGEDLVWLRSEPEFDLLRSDPRFQDLLRRMNFPP